MRIRRDMAIGVGVAIVASTVSFALTYHQRDGFWVRTGYPAQMLTLNAVGSGLFWGLMAFLVAITLDAFWVGGKRE